MPQAFGGSKITDANQISNNIIVDAHVNSAAGIQSSKLKLAKMIFSTILETAARFYTLLTGSGAVTYGISGALISPGGTATSSTNTVWQITNGNNGKVYNGSPTISINLGVGNILPASGAGVAFFGLGTVVVSGADITLTNNHIGFKIVKSGGVATLYATQGDGVTEKISAALTTVVNGDDLDLIAVVNGTTSVDYYWRKNGGVLSAAINLAGNMPAADTLENSITFASSNQATAFDFPFLVNGLSYQR